MGDLYGSGSELHGSKGSVAAAIRERDEQFMHAGQPAILLGRAAIRLAERVEQIYRDPGLLWSIGHRTIQSIGTKERPGLWPLLAIRSEGSLDTPMVTDGYAVSMVRPFTQYTHLALTHCLDNPPVDGSPGPDYHIVVNHDGPNVKSVHVRGSDFATLAALAALSPQEAERQYQVDLVTGPPASEQSLFADARFRRGVLLQVMQGLPVSVPPELYIPPLGIVTECMDEISAGI